MPYPVPDPFKVLPDLDGLEVAVDTETSGSHPDDGARVATVSVAWFDPVDGRPREYAFPFDQGNRPGKPEWTGQETLFGVEDVNLPLEAWVHLMYWLRRQWLIMNPALFDAPMIRAGTRMAETDRWWTGPRLIDRVRWDTMIGSKEIYPLEMQALKVQAVRLELLKGTEWAERNGGWEHGIEARDQERVKAHLSKIKVKSGGTAHSTGRWDLGDWDAIGPYAALDALETLLLYRHQRQRLEQGRDGSLGPAAKVAAKWIPRELRKQKVLYCMMERGVGFDRGKCLAAAAEITKARDLVATELPFKPTINAARQYWFGDGKA